MIFDPKNKIIKIIALVVCACFLWQDVAWAEGSDFLRQRQFRQQFDRSSAQTDNHGSFNTTDDKTTAGAAGLVAAIIAASLVGGFLLYIATLGVLYAFGVVKRDIWPFSRISGSKARYFWAQETLGSNYPRKDKYPEAYTKLSWEKREAIEFLGKYGDKERARILLEAALNDPVPMVQQMAHETLIKLGFSPVEASVYCDYDNAFVKETAEQIVSGLEEPGDKVTAVSRWVQENIVFEFTGFDIPASETLAAKIGTCYHATNLQIALLRSLGFRARFVVARFRNEVFKDLIPEAYYRTLGELSPHVYCEVLVDGAWRRFDVIQDRGLAFQGFYPLDVASGRELRRYDSLDSFITRGASRVARQKTPYMEGINEHIRTRFGSLNIYDLFQQVAKDLSADAKAGGMLPAAAGGANAMWYMPDSERQQLLIRYGVYTARELRSVEELYQLYLWDGELTVHQKALVWTYMILMRMDKGEKFDSIDKFINDPANQSEIQGLYIGYEWPPAMSLRKRLRIARRAIRKARSVVEIGCTDGDVLFRLAKERPGTNFLGLDASPYNIRAAVEKLAGKRKPPENLKFRVRDCRPAVDGVPNRGIPRPNKSVGAVLIIEGVMDSDEYPQQWKNEIAGEALRVLRPGGRIGFIGVYGAEEIRSEVARLGLSIAPDKISKVAYHMLLRGIGGDYETGRLGRMAGFVWQISANATGNNIGDNVGLWTKQFLDICRAIPDFITDHRLMGWLTLSPEPDRFEIAMRLCRQLHQENIITAETAETFIEKLFKNGVISKKHRDALIVMAKELKDTEDMRQLLDVVHDILNYFTPINGYLLFSFNEPSYTPQEKQLFQRLFYLNDERDKWLDKQPTEIDFYRLRSSEPGNYEAIIKAGHKYLAELRAALTGLDESSFMKRDRLKVLIEEAGLGGQDPDKTTDEILGAFRHEIDKGLNLLNSYLYGNEAPEEINVVSEIKDIVRVFALENDRASDGQAPKINFSIEIEEAKTAVGQACVNMKPTCFQDVIRNPLNNAVFNMPQQEDAFIKVRISLENSSVIIRIMDNAGGIPVERNGIKIRENVLKAYVTTKQTKQEAAIKGRGLTITKQYVEDAEGKISVEDTVTKEELTGEEINIRQQADKMDYPGTIIRLELPISQAAAIGVSPSPVEVRRIKNWIGSPAGKGKARGTTRDAAIAEAVGTAQRRQTALLIAAVTAFAVSVEEAKRRLARQKTALIIDTDEVHAEKIKQNITLDGSREFKEIAILINPSQALVDTYLAQKSVDLIINYGYNINIYTSLNSGLFIIQPRVQTNTDIIEEQIDAWLVEQCV